MYLVNTCSNGAVAGVIRSVWERGREIDYSTDSLTWRTLKLCTDRFDLVFFAVF